jgi:hypothetical protein
MHRVGFEPTTPVFVRAKTVYVLDRAATVFCKKIIKTLYNLKNGLSFLKALESNLGS